MRSMADGNRPALRIASSIIRSRRSACPCRVANRSRASTFFPVATTTEHANPVASSAKVNGSAGSAEAARPKGVTLGPNPDGPLLGALPGRAAKPTPRPKPDGERPQIGSYRAHLHNFRDVISKHILDSSLQCRGRTRAAGAGALHMEVNDPVFVVVKNNVAAILRNRRAHACLQQLLDL